MVEQRLPFPIHGTRTSGAGGSAPVQTEAKRLLYMANLIADTAGVPVFGLASQSAYGSASASVAGPLAFKRTDVGSSDTSEDQQPIAQAVARLVWLPEGFVITPRTESAPAGYGMPPTADGRGTPGGPLTQVIINKFKNNQYPDALYRYCGAPIVRGTAFCANLFFMDWEMKDKNLGVGVMIEYADGAKVMRPQFKKRWKSEYREPESKDWYCHRPSYPIVKEPKFEKAVREKTNEIRAGADRKALGRPLRGSEGELTRDVLYQIWFSGETAHNSEEFREGHQTFKDRARARMARFNSVGENLHADSNGAPGTEAFALSAMEAWRQSPAHYENMVTDWHDENRQYAWVDSASGAWFRQGNVGGLATQIFYGAGRWVAFGIGTHEEDPPVTTVDADTGADMFITIYPQYPPGSDADLQTYYPKVAYRGRAIRITEEPVTWTSSRVLGASMVRDNPKDKDAITLLRVAVHERPNTFYGQTCVTFYEGLSYDFLKTKQVVGRYWLPFEDGNFLSRVQWSKSGKKAVFCYTEIVKAPTGWLDGKFQAKAYDSKTIGQKITFVEYDAGAQTLGSVYSNTLTITPTSFGWTQTGPGEGVAYHKQECIGECHLLAAYDKEDLVYATIKYDATVDWRIEKFPGSNYEKTVRGILSFPDGTELTYSQIDITTETRGSARVAYAEGFVRHLLPFDIMDPGGVAYIQYDLPSAANGGWFTAGLHICGEVVKFAQDPFQYGQLGRYGRWLTVDDGVPSQTPTVGAHRGLSIGIQMGPYEGGHHVQGPTFFTSMSGYLIHRTPSVPYPAALVSYSHNTAPYPLPRGNDLETPWDEWNEYVLVGPTILWDGILEYNVGIVKRFERSSYRRVEHFRQCKYKGERLYAGRIQNTLGGAARQWSSYHNDYVRPSLWPDADEEGKNEYFWYCTTDLRKITNMPDLEDNILPIGVL